MPANRLRVDASSARLWRPSRPARRRRRRGRGTPICRAAARAGGPPRPRRTGGPSSSRRRPSGDHRRDHWRSARYRPRRAGGDEPGPKSRRGGGSRGLRVGVTSGARAPAPDALAVPGRLLPSSGRSLPRRLCGGLRLSGPGGGLRRERPLPPPLWSGLRGGRSGRTAPGRAVRRRMGPGLPGYRGASRPQPPSGPQPPSPVRPSAELNFAGEPGRRGGASRLELRDLRRGYVHLALPSYHLRARVLELAVRLRDRALPAPSSSRGVLTLLTGSIVEPRGSGPMMRPED